MLQLINVGSDPWLTSACVLTGTLQLTQHNNMHIHSLLLTKCMNCPIFAHGKRQHILVFHPLVTLKHFYMLLD